MMFSLIGVAANAPTRPSQRIATVEPVFANIRRSKRLQRFDLRGKVKVNTQRHLYCLVHNIEKLTNSAWMNWVKATSPKHLRSLHNTPMQCSRASTRQRLISSVMLTSRSFCQVQNRVCIQLG
jgi:hypothetical protein